MRAHELFTVINEIREVPVPKGRKGLVQPGEEIDPELKDNLRKMGWRWVSAGSFSTVFSKGEHVLKIFLDDEVPGTRCLIRFHRMAMKVNNPHFPKVNFVKTYKGVRHDKIYPPQQHKQHFIIGTEKLYPIDISAEKKIWNTMPFDQKERAKRIAFYSTGGVSIINPEDAINELDGMGFISSKGVPLHAKVSRGIKVMDKLAIEYIQDNYEDDPLVKALSLVKQMPIKDQSCFTDMGGSNTMMRKDGTIVLSDPIADDEYWA